MNWHHSISTRCLLMFLVMKIYLVNIKPLCRLVIQVVAEDDHHLALASGGYSSWTFLLFLWKHHSWRRTWSTMHLCVIHSALHWGMVYTHTEQHRLVGCGCTDGQCKSYGMMTMAPISFFCMWLFNCRLTNNGKKARDSVLHLTKPLLCFAGTGLV